MEELVADMRVYIEILKANSVPSGQEKCVVYNSDISNIIGTLKEMERA